MTITPGLFSKQVILFKDEVTFCEVLSTVEFAIPVKAIRYETVSGRANDKSIQRRLWDTRPGYRMPRSNGTIQIEVYACGSQLDTATGALTATWLQKLLAGALGGSDLTQVGGVAGAAATTTSVPAGTGTRTRGALNKVGIAGDGRGNGQGVVIGNPTTSFLNALDGAPNAGDVIRAGMGVYLKETLGTSKRFMVHYVDSGAQYLFHGCHAESVVLNVVHGDLPYFTITYRYAYWRTTSGVDTTGVTLENCDVAVSAGGSYFLNNVGTSTRVLAEAIEFELTLNLGLTPIFGQGGLFGGLQHVVGFVRTKANPDDPAGTLRLRVPYDSAIQADFGKDGSDSSFFHCLWTLSVGEGTDSTEGRHLMGYNPRMYRIGGSPEEVDANTLGYMDLNFALREGPDSTTDLTLSACRMDFT